MKHIIFLNFFLGIFARLNQPVNNLPILGQWQQLYSSRYVQESYEIDWHCIHVNISTDNENHVIIEKKPLIHHLPSNLTFKESYDVHDSDILVPNGQYYVTIFPNLVIKNEDQYIILVGQDNLSLFILSKNATVFETEYKKEALDKVKSFNFTTYYKFPLPLFTNC
jgi:hypothetical protein